MGGSGTAGRRRTVLLLCHFYPGAAGTIIDHISAFSKFSENDYFVLSNLGDLPEWLDLSRFDALIFHYSLIACHDNYISPSARKRIRDYQGFKAAFVQDDYRWINDTVNAFAYMRINALFPLTNSDIMDAVYDPTKLRGVRRETVLAGYVPQDLVELSVKPFHERTMDVVYRARKLPAWMGSHTLQKWKIADLFNSDAPRYGLTVDISVREEDRIYGPNWVEFVADSRATLGTESGASLCDFTGLIQRNVEEHERKYPDSDFETLEELYFKGQDGLIMMNVISPRCFEAAALRTLMILYEGDYSGVLKPWRHYVPLKKDHSNMDEVVRVLSSPDEAQQIVDRAYNEIAKNPEYSYEAMVGLVDRVMNEEWSELFESSDDRMSHNEFDWLAMNNPREPRHFNSEGGKRSLLYSASMMSDMGFSDINEDRVLYLDLDSPIRIDTVFLRWKVSPAQEGEGFRLRGVCKKKIRFTREITANAITENIAVVEILPKGHVVDRLELLYSSETPLQVARPLWVSIVGFAEDSRPPFIVSLKSIFTELSISLWALFPEGVRSIIRPIVRKIRVYS